MLTGALLLLVLAIVAAALLTYHREAERDSTSRIIQRVDEILPQTQCRQCGYRGCQPYAEAVVLNETSIDKCLPGGHAVQRALSDLLGLGYEHTFTEAHAQPQVALIEEALCIGCTKCIEACPVDAIVGAPQLMHSVLGEQCTGCELCIEPCPVDCIVLAPATATDTTRRRWM